MTELEKTISELIKDYANSNKISLSDITDATISTTRLLLINSPLITQARKTNKLMDNLYDDMESRRGEDGIFIDEDGVDITEDVEFILGGECAQTDPMKIN